MIEALAYIGLVVLIINILTVVIVFGTYKYKKWDRVNNKIVAHLDEMATNHKGRVVLTLYNVWKHKHIWNTNVANLKYYIFGEEVEGCDFMKHTTIRGAMKILYPAEFSNQLVIKSTKALINGDFKISADNGYTFEKLSWISEKELNSKKHHAHGETEAYDLRKSLFDDYKNSDKQFRFDYADLIDVAKGTHVHINESESTATTLRYQMIIPEDYLQKIDFDPDSVRLYHTFEGHLYEFDIKYLGHEGDFYQWDLYNLQPGTAYVGLSLNSSHNPLIRPSKAFYGITKDENAEANNLDGAQIAKPSPEMKKHAMWDEKTSIEAIGETLTSLQYKIIVKKHEEYHDEENFVFINDAEKLFDKYSWLKTGKSLDEE